MSDQRKASGPRQVVRREVPEIDAETRAKLAYLSTQGVIPDACMDCVGVAIIRARGEGRYEARTFHDLTCPEWHALARRAGGTPAGDDEPPATDQDTPGGVE